jgi:hypothetical protein
LGEADGAEGSKVKPIKHPRTMKVTKHYEQDHVILYVEEGDLRTCITLDNDNQMRRLGQCLTDLYRTDGREVTIEPKAE